MVRVLLPKMVMGVVPGLVNEREGDASGAHEVRRDVCTSHLHCTAVGAKIITEVVRVAL